MAKILNVAESNALVTNMFVSRFGEFIAAAENSIQRHRCGMPVNASGKERAIQYRESRRIAGSTVFTPNRGASRDLE